MGELADEIEKEIEKAIADRRAGEPFIPLVWADVEWRQIVAALRLASASNALSHKAAVLDDAIECCDCESSDWRCMHAVKRHERQHAAAIAEYERALTAYRGTVSA